MTFTIGHVQGGTHAGWRRPVEARAKADWKCPSCKSKLRYYWTSCPNCKHPRD